jgi:hypothetical protein
MREHKLECVQCRVGDQACIWYLYGCILHFSVFRYKEIRGILCTRVGRYKVSRSKVVSSFSIYDIFYVVIVFKIHEIIYLRKGQYITGDIL